MTQTVGGDIDVLRAAVAGPVIGPEGAGAGGHGARRRAQHRGLGSR
jgi:hypothetical protein